MKSGSPTEVSSSRQACQQTARVKALRSARGEKSLLGQIWRKFNTSDDFTTAFFCLILVCPTINDVVPGVHAHKHKGAAVLFMFMSWPTRLSAVLCKILQRGSPAD